MRVLAMLLGLTLCVMAMDTTSPCVPTSSSANVLGSCANATMLEDGKWTAFTVGPAAVTCFTFNATSPDVDDTMFVLALRAGSDGTGQVSDVQADVYNSNNTAFGCAALQEGQSSGDMDFHCLSLTNLNGVSTAFITAANRNTTNSTSLEIYAGFSTGDISTCSASYVDGNGSNAWIWIVLGVVVVVAIVLVIIAAVGFVLYKKKNQKSAYDLYEDA
jgi:hypothetical protein